MAETFEILNHGTKREEDGKQLVDLDVWTDNAAGHKTTPGKATVVLNA